MWLRDIISLLKRGQLVAGAAAMSVILALTAFVALPDEYASTATLILTTSPYNSVSTPGDTIDGPVTNPLFDFSNGLNTTAALLVQVMNTGSILDGLESSSRATITISDVGGAEFLGSKGPFLFITGTSTSSPDTAHDIVVRGIQMTEKELVSRQDSLGAPTSQLISLLTVVDPTIPTVSVAPRLWGAGIALIVGFVLVIGGAYTRERLRETTRWGGQDPAAAASDPEAPDAEPLHAYVTAPAMEREHADTVPAAAPSHTEVATLQPTRSAAAVNRFYCTETAAPDPGGRPNPPPSDTSVDVHSQTEQIVGKRGRATRDTGLPRRRPRLPGLRLASDRDRNGHPLLDHGNEATAEDGTSP